ncbi:hypothetical protein Tco_1361487 [Tanacetum coccineum]
MIQPESEGSTQGYPLVSVEVLSHEVSISTEGVEEWKRNVRIKGEKKEALYTLRKLIGPKWKGPWKAHDGPSIVGQANPTDCLSPVTGPFLKELRENRFSGSNNEDANEHVEKVLKIVDLFHILDSRGAIPTVTVADAKTAIQEMAEYSQKWHNGTSKGRSTETYNGLAAIQAQLNILGREIKKVNEKVYDAQVGCEQ